MKENRAHNTNTIIRAFIIFIISCLIVTSVVPLAFAQSVIPKVKHSVKPLDLSRVPTTNELMAAGQLGGQLYPTADIKIDNRTLKQGIKGLKISSINASKFKLNKSINLSFGRAIQEWNKHNYKQAVKMFRKHVQDFPDSPWVSEANLHAGCDARYNGRYTEAEGLFNGIIDDNKGKTLYGSRMLLNKARQRLGILKLLQSNFDEAISHFSKLKEESPDWRHRTYASHWIQRIARYKSNELALLSCGTEALAHVLMRDGREREAREVMDMSPTSLTGHSMSDLISIAESYGYKVTGLKLKAAELKSIPLPAIMQINRNSKGDRGHYWILEGIIDNELKLVDSQSRRTYSQSIDEFLREWDGNTLVFSDDKNLPGIRLSDKEMAQIYGACCGTPRPVDPLGDLGEPMSPDQTDPACGSPVWKVNMISINLFVTDIPLWYRPAIGPSVKIQLSYNSQSSIAYYEPFGNKWQFNYGSYLIMDTSQNVLVFMPDGRRDSYMNSCEYVNDILVCNDNFTPPSGIYNSLVKIGDNHYELHFPDGTVNEYDVPAGSGLLQPFLVEIRDAYGQKLTFGYDTNGNLQNITDAAGQVTTLIYNAAGLVEQVDDPFGRSALFEYDANDNLTKITDMGGYWASFTYDADVYLTSLEKPQGTWDFYIEPADGTRANTDTYPPPGDDMWANYRMTITNPLGGKEEYMYFAGCGYGSCAGMSWHVSPRNYIEWESATINNYNSNAPKTVYEFRIQGASRRGKIRKITYPEGGYVEYWHDSDGNRTSMQDYYGNATSYTYNSMGRVTSMTDAKGNITNYVYAPNGVDLIQVDNGLGPVVMTYNNSHDTLSITDRLNNSTLYQYNGYGQLTQITDPLGTISGYTYDVNNRLQQISKSGSVIQSFTYDSIGRTDTSTDATGLVLNYDYNNLNKVTKVTYPDSKFADYTYSSCCPHLIDSVTDRAGKTTSNTYDALRRLTETIDHKGRTIKNEYDKNGNLIKFIDTNSNVTSFEYNYDNRQVRKNYADGKYETVGYYPTGLLLDQTNARGITKSYTYDQNHNLETVTYSDTTPGITYTYDNYNRVTQRQDGIGTYAYGYDDNNRLTNIDGPWTNDTVTIQYNELNNLISMTPQGGQAITYKYDYDTGYTDSDLGRLKDIIIGANTYSYGYTGVNPLVQSLTRPNESVTDYLYNDPLKRLTEISNKDSSLAVINKHVFTYNDLDVIGTETITTGTTLDSFTDGMKTYDHNNLNQLLSSTNPAESFIYDDDGNMTQGYTPAEYQFSAAYDADNRLISIVYNDGAVDHETKYFYSGDSMLARIEKYENVVLVDEVRFVRSGFLPVQERDGTNAVTREYTWGLNVGGGIGGLLNLNQGGSDYSYLYDGKGNVMALIDGSQNLAASYRYDTFGNIIKKTGTLDQLYQFSTKRYDDKTGLSYYGYRFYNPAIGQWITRDPLGEAGGINLYGFVGNNPINFIDPWGLETYRCTKPLDALGGSGSKSGPDIGGNPAYHQYSCVVLSNGAYQCGGQDHAGSWFRGPGKPSNDDFRPDSCEQSQPDNDCFERCLRDEWSKPRPTYGIPFGTDCQEYDNNINQHCLMQCNSN